MILTSTLKNYRRERVKQAKNMQYAFIIYLEINILQQVDNSRS